MAGRARRPRARRERPVACAADVRRIRVRSQGRPGGVLIVTSGAFDQESTRRSAKAGDLTLNYFEAGESTDAIGGGLPLIMLHGGGPGASAWSNFGPALPGFAASFRTLLVDQPGFGQSDKPAVVR